MKKIAFVPLLALAVLCGCGRKPVSGPAEQPPAPSAVSAPASASPAPLPATGDLEIVRQRGCLRFLLLRTEDLYLPRQGTPPNQACEIAEGFCRLLGVKPEAVFVERGDELVPALISGRGDLIASDLSAQLIDNPHIAFTSPITFYRELIVGRSRDQEFKRVANLKGRTIGVQRGTPLWETAADLNRRYPEIRLRVLPDSWSPEQVLGQVVDGKLDLALADSLTMSIVQPYRPELKVLLDLGKERGSAWAVRAGNRRLLRDLNRYLKSAGLTRRHAAAYKADWPGITKRKTLRVITLNTQATYFIWKGELVGFEYEMAKRFADQNGLRLEVVVAPDQADLIPYLLAGKGDFIASFLTATEQRRAAGLDFSRPYHQSVKTVVARAGETGIKTVKDLAGRELVLPRATSAWSVLENFQAGGITLKLRAAPDNTQPEDLLELVAAGKIDLTVVDHHTLNMALGWIDGIRGVLPLGQPVAQGWGARAADRKLLAAINEFWKKEYRGAVYNLAYNRYFKSPEKVRQIYTAEVSRNPGGGISPYDQYVQYFSGKYRFDWRMVVAQMYQESRFDPRQVSPMGARGLLQVMPRTAAEYGFDNLVDPPTGIHAGVKYLEAMRARLGDIADETNRIYFALAAYNAGAGHVNDARDLTRRLGRNPDIWFGHVEEAMLLLSQPDYARQAKYGFVRGQEPVNYVRQIQARYRAYAGLD